MHEPFEILGRLREQSRMPQSLLFYGPSFSAVESYSASLIKALLCTRGDGCGVCQECLSFVAGDHPEVFVCGTGMTSRADGEASAVSSRDSIKIDSIRHAIEHLGWYSAPRADGRRSWRIVWIRQAANMTEQAANAFLKTLEEPPQGSIIVMTVRHPRMLLDTLRSRLVAIRIPGREALPDFSEDVVKSVRASMLSGNVASTLHGAEEVSRQIRMKPSEYAVAAEIVLNREYRRLVTTGNKASSSFARRCHERRLALGQLHQIAGQQRIALNMQLAAEMTGAITEPKDDLASLRGRL